MPRPVLACLEGSCRFAKLAFDVRHEKAEPPPEKPAPTPEVKTASTVKKAATPPAKKPATSTKTSTTRKKRP
jgi:hypothetical protein